MKIAEIIDLSFCRVQRILTDNLEMKHVAARWVPHALNEVRIQFTQEILKILDSRVLKRTIKERLVVTDEKFIYHRALGTKQSNSA